jgi:hypothetical protein
MLITCPHCQCEVFLEDLGCRIFRHASYKTNLEPIPPHTSEEECKKLVEANLVYGCAKPFRLNEKDEVEICDYI